MPSVTWTKNNQPLQESKSVVIVFDERTFKSTLEITDCFPENFGSYTCIAVNEAGRAETTAELEILRKLIESIRCNI